MCSGELPIGKGPALAERASNLGWNDQQLMPIYPDWICDTESLDVQSGGYCSHFNRDLFEKICGSSSTDAHKLSQLSILQAISGGADYATVRRVMKTLVAAFWSPVGMLTFYAGFF